MLRYDVYRTPPGGSPTVAGSTVVGSFTDAAVTQSGVYGYAVKAVDGAGNVGTASTSVSVTYDNASPTAPASLNGTTPTASPPVLTWTASTDALSGVDHYDVYRGGTRINSSPLTGLTYTDTSPIVASQTYSVKAVDAAGNAEQPPRPRRSSSTTRTTRARRRCRPRLRPRSTRR